MGPESSGRTADRQSVPNGGTGKNRWIFPVLGHLGVDLLDSILNTVVYPGVAGGRWHAAAPSTKTNRAVQY